MGPSQRTSTSVSLNVGISDWMEKRRGRGGGDHERADGDERRERRADDARKRALVAMLKALNEGRLAALADSFERRRRLSAGVSVSATIIAAARAARYATAIDGKNAPVTP